MASFGIESNKQLDSCNYKLQKVARIAIKLMDFRVLEGHRDEARQNALLNEDPPKTTLPWPKSKHNEKPSMAFDLAPYPLDWSNHPKAIARFYLLAGVILAVAYMIGVKLRWGGDWDGDWDLFDQKFDDLGHFELDY